MNEYATIVRAFQSPDWLGRRYRAAVVLGTAERYHPAPYAIRRWTAQGAKRAGDRKIRRIERRRRAQHRRDTHAALVTRPPKSSEQESDTRRDT